MLLPIGVADVVMHWACWGSRTGLSNVQHQMVALYSANIALNWVLHTSQLAFRYTLSVSAPLPLITMHLSSTQYMNLCNHEVHPLHCSCLYTASSCSACVL